MYCFQIGLEKDELDTLISTCATDGRRWTSVIIIIISLGILTTYRNPIASDIVHTNDSDNVSEDNDNNGGDGSDSGDNGGDGSDSGDNGSDGSDVNDNNGSDEDSEDNGSDDEIDKLYGLENYSDEEDCVAASGRQSLYNNAVNLLLCYFVLFTINLPFLCYL